MKMRFLVLIIVLMPCSFLHSQDTLEEIVTWEMPEGETFNCVNLNSGGSDLNNDGYDDFILLTNYYEWKYYFYLGSQDPTSQYDLEIEVPFGAGYPSWGGDLNGDGYKDIVFGKATNEFDPGDVYICLGSEEIDLEPELVLHGEDYVPDPIALYLTGFNGGYDFNNDGYDDLLTYGEGPSLLWNGLIQIFLGGEELSATPDFQIQGNIEEEFGRARAVGDINGDGYDDLIVSRDETMSGPAYIEVYLGGEIIDTMPDFVTNEAFNIGRSYANGDINNDGYDDLLISHAGIFLGNQNNTLILNYPLSDYSQGYSNINNDEYEDILYHEYDTGILNILYGSCNFDTIPDIIHDANVNLCNIGDFNNDDEDEILLNDGDSYNSATMYGLPGDSNIDNYDLKITNYELSKSLQPRNYNQLRFAC